MSKQANPQAIDKLIEVMADLRHPDTGCPWDIEQTHESLVTNMIEEAYEAVDAIRIGDAALMREELGDLLLQVVMHARIGSETDKFNLDSIAMTPETQNTKQMEI